MKKAKKGFPCCRITCFPSCLKRLKKFFRSKYFFPSIILLVLLIVALITAVAMQKPIRERAKAILPSPTPCPAGVESFDVRISCGTNPNRYRYTIFTCLDGSINQAGSGKECKTQSGWKTYANSVCSQLPKCLPSPPCPVGIKTFYVNLNTSCYYGYQKGNFACNNGYQETFSGCKSYYEWFRYANDKCKNPATCPSTPTPSPTISPSPSPSISPSPSPTGTPTPTEQVGLKIKFQCINQKPQDTQNQTVGLTFIPSDNQLTLMRPVDFSPQNDGTYLGYVGPTFPNQQITLLVKGPKHLQRKFENITLTPGQTIDLTSKIMEAGDLPSQDGKVDRADYDTLISRIGQEYQPSELDINMDDIINMVDVSCLIDTLSVKQEEE